MQLWKRDGFFEVWPQPPHRELWMNDTTRLPDLEARGPAFCLHISKSLVMGRPLGEDKGGPVTSQAFLGNIAPRLEGSSLEKGTAMSFQKSWLQ